MARFELKKSKALTFFWEIDWTEGSASFSLRFGKVGGEPPEPVVREFPTPFAAKKERDRLIAAKKTEGYVEVTHRPAGPRENPELLSALLENPKDVKAFLVYADWLQSIGDPHGELIAVHSAILEAKDDPDRRARLRKQERAILEEHEGDLLFGLGPYLDRTRITWRLGFVAGCDVRFRQEDAADAGKFVEDLLDLRVGRMLRDLTVRIETESADVDFLDVIAALERRAPATLRSLALLAHAGRADGDPYSAGRCDVGDLAPLWKALPRLKRLAIAGSTVELGTIGTSRLEELSLEMTEPPAEEMRAVREASWPKLRSFVLRVGQVGDDLGDVVRAEHVEPLLHRAPSLVSIGLRNFEEGDELVGMLVATPVAHRLEALDLSLSGVTDEGAESLASYAPVMTALARIDVSRTTLTARGAERLKAAFPRAEVVAGDLRAGYGAAERFDGAME